MADVRTVSVDKDERSQLVLVFAMTLAVVFVVLALFLNTAIYTENIATREGDIAGASEAATYRDSAVGYTEDQLEYVNYNHNQTYPTLHANLTQQVDTWSDLNGKMRLLQASSANASVRSVWDGTRISQVAFGNFTNISGASDWTLVRNTNRVRDIDFTVQKSSLLDTGPGAGNYPDAFQMTFIGDGPNERGIRIYQNTTGIETINVEVVDGTGSVVGGSCAYETGPGAARVTIDVTNGSLGPKPCPALENLDEELSNNLQRPLIVAFNNSISPVSTPNIEGTFNVTVLEVNVDGGSYGSSSNHYYAEGSTDGVFRTEAIYAVELEVRYRTSRVRFDTVIRLAPGEVR